MDQELQDRPWDERLDNPSQHSLVDLLDGFYKAFHIDDYLDQIGIIDDRLDEVLNQLRDLQFDIHDLPDNEIQDRIANIINLIDAGNSPD
jgi:hypothetical protein